MSGGFVIAFHEIPAAKAAELIESLEPANVVHLSELVARSRSGKSTAGLVAITVDDGVGYNVRTLAALCTVRSWPVTFFLTTDYVEYGEGMPFQWWRQIEPLLPKKRIHLKNSTLDLTRPGSLEAFSRAMVCSWHEKRMDYYLPVIAELRDVIENDYGLTREQLKPPEPISWAEVEQMSKNSLIRFESHCVTHAALSTLSREELRHEMKHSRDTISEHTGRECRHLAYPFGSRTSIGIAAVNEASTLYDSAATMLLGDVDESNPWMLPRIPLYPENPAWMARLKVLVKCTHLKPRSATSRQMTQTVSVQTPTVVHSAVSPLPAQKRPANQL